jgi:hypothetical protein
MLHSIAWMVTLSSCDARYVALTSLPVLWFRLVEDIVDTSCFCNIIDNILLKTKDHSP